MLFSIYWFLANFQKLAPPLQQASVRCSIERLNERAFVERNYRSSNERSDEHTFIERTIERTNIRSSNERTNIRSIERTFERT